MKIPVIFVTILLLCLAYLVTVDVIAGVSFPEAIRILVQSFSVVTIQEKIIVFVAIIMPFLMPFISSSNKKKKAKTK